MTTNPNAAPGQSGANQLPLWFIEGMAEYLSIGPVDTNTAMWLRDAARREKLPYIDKLDDPRYFPLLVRPRILAPPPPPRGGPFGRKTRRGGSTTWIAGAGTGSSSAARPGTAGSARTMSVATSRWSTPAIASYVTVVVTPARGQPRGRQREKARGHSP